MTIRQILTEPDPQLRIKSKPVQKVDAEIKKLMKDMLETMYAAPGKPCAPGACSKPKVLLNAL